ncbi:transposase domain-containing protein [Streptomyces sp. NPDC079020]|uniref:transposase domain-containing protein n=1 Tax=Streptomyces sp. NPDC079020 TaxID=3365722 RepID=UPI0037D094CD
MPSRLTAITSPVTVAAGRFAPGHLGELTSIVSFELVDAVLSETRTVQRRLRDLPSRVGVYFLLAMCLFPEIGYRLVWDKLTAGLSGMPVVRPSVKALRDLRRRLGSPPVRALFEVLAGPLAQPTTPGLRFGPFRTVLFDGCSSIKVPDSERNRGWLGRCPHGGYPQVELMTLVETGTRAVIGAVFGPTRGGRDLVRHQAVAPSGPRDVGAVGPGLRRQRLPRCRARHRRTGPGPHSPAPPPTGPPAAR